MKRDMAYPMRVEPMPLTWRERVQITLLTAFLAVALVALAFAISWVPA